MYVNKETELYNLKREYDEWEVRLGVCMNNNDYNDLIKIINPIMSEFNDGDLTKIPNVDWFYAVSYTHLDVYKRQGLESIFFICIERRGRFVLNDKLWLEIAEGEILIEMGCHTS